MVEEGIPRKLTYGHRTSELPGMFFNTQTVSSSVCDHDPRNAIASAFAVGTLTQSKNNEYLHNYYGIS